MPKRKNPGAKNLEQWLGAVNQVCTKKKQKAGVCSRSNDAETRAAVKLIRETPASRRSEFGAQQRARRRRNGGAEDLYEAFHGQAATRETEITEAIHAPTKLTELGRLIELQVILPNGRELATIPMRGRGVIVAAAGIQRDGGQVYGTELHFVGGNQSVDLRALELEHQAGKPGVLLGTLHKLTYHTTKDFHDFEPSNYEHELGEETGEKPICGYDPRSKKLYLVGGAYAIRREGIVN